MCWVAPNPENFYMLAKVSEPDSRTYGDGFREFFNSGKVLKDGELIEIEWPDKSTSIHTVRTRQVGHGSDSSGWTTEAYIDVHFRGVAGQVTVHGLKARRTKRPKPKFDARGARME